MKVRRGSSSTSAEFSVHGEDYNALLFGNALYRNLGGENLRRRQSLLEWKPLWPWGIATGDFDNDGHEDAFITAGRVPVLLLAEPADDEQRQRHLH
jgi:hypothetical protein